MQNFTHNELQVIIEANKQEKDYLEMEVKTPNGSWIAPFCGICGRIVHHPECPEANWSKPEEDA